MTRRLRVVLPVAVAAATVLAPAGASAGPAPKPDACPTNKPMVVDVSVTYRNIGDLGADGHVWALDRGTQQVQMWRIGTNAYCVRRHDIGTFTSFAGVSPVGTGTIRAGVTGPFEALTYLRINGQFAPTVPTTGYLGDFDGRCQQDGTCSGEEPRLIFRYFSRLNHLDFGAFAFTADGGACGTWTETPSGDTGDIVCP